MRRLIAAAAAAALALGTPPRAEGVRLKAVGSVYEDAKGIGFSAPEGVAVTGGTLAVADTGHGRIVFYSLDGERIAARGEAVLPELPSPTRMAFAPSGELLVVDGKLRRVGRVSPEGAFRGYLELPPHVVPHSLRVGADGKVWLLDVGGGRVLTLDAAGAVAKERALPAEPLAAYSDLAVSARGDVLVIDSVGHRVLVAKAGTDAFVPFGASLSSEVDFATSLEVHGSGLVLVADKNGGGIVALGADGSFRGRQSGPGWKEGLLRYPSALVIAGDRLFVADRGNARIGLFTIAP